MKIRKVSCEQFAGLGDFGITFRDGMNVVYGRNETGKSTLINLIYRLLFQNAAVGKKEAADKEFRARFYPAAMREGTGGDYVEGTLVFETEAGVYELHKEWGDTGSCKLTACGSKFNNEDTIKQILESSQALCYGRGIYHEIIFANQKNQYQALQALLKEQTAKSTKKAGQDGMKTELAALVSQAVMETGGVSVEKLRQAVEQKINEAVYHWDEDADRPEKGREIDNPWNLGEGKTAKQARILKAYYSMRAYEKEKRMLEKLEDELQEALADDQKVMRQRQQAQEDYDKLHAIKGSLQRKNDLERLKQNALSALQELEDAKTHWPACAEQMKQAQSLQAESAAAKIKEKYEQAHSLQTQLAQIRKKLEGYRGLEENTVKTARELFHTIEHFRAQLSGINLDARFKKLGSYKVEVTAAASGKIIEPENMQPEYSGHETARNKDGVQDAAAVQQLHIEEAVRIVIPNVMELELSAAGVDIAQVQQELTRAQSQLSEILSCYHTEHVDALQKMLDEKQELSRQEQQHEQRLSALLGGDSYEQLKMEYDSLPETAVQDQDTVLSKICALCGTDTLDLYIGKLQGRIEHYTARYGSIEKLSQSIEQQKMELAKYQDACAAISDIPKEYGQIVNPEEELAARKQKIAHLAKESEEKKKVLLGRQALLGQCLHTAEELQELIEAEHAQWEQEKEELRHWRHIQAVFQQMAQDFDHAPVQDIADRFQKNLEALAGSSVSAAALDPQFTALLYSKERKMSFDILSEGTKGTAALAFRLAVIGHLFPHGGGLAVFDDPFTDMDKERRMAACRLVQEFAKENQVIFATCDERYAEWFETEPICME